MAADPTSRGIFPRQIATAAGEIAVGAGSVATPAAAADAASAGYRCLSPDESSFAEALVNVMCPADDSTPNGVDCGLADYIDRQLAGGFRQPRRQCLQPRRRSGKQQFGYQPPLTPEQFFRTGVTAAQVACAKRHNRRFEELTLAEADVFLLDAGAGKLDDDELSLAHWLNDLVYPLFLQACFADPPHGGSKGKVFWKLIGYPGLPAFISRNIVNFGGKRLSS